MSLPKQKRRPGCLTDLALDREFSGELNTAAREAASLHLKGCARCRERRAEVLAAGAEFLAQRPWTEPSSGVRTRSGGRFLGAVAGVLAVAAAVALLMPVGVLEEPVPGEEADIRLKGAPRIGFFVEHASGAVRGARGQDVAAGDRIRFTYTSARAVYLAVYGMDASGASSVYFPAEEEAALVGPGTDVPVTTVVELDDVLGGERIVALLCDAAFVVEERRGLATQGSPPPAGCTIDSFEWEKKAAPR